MDKEEFLDLGTIYREDIYLKGQLTGSTFGLERDNKECGKVQWTTMQEKYFVEYMVALAREEGKTGFDALQYSNLQRQEIRLRCTRFRSTLGEETIVRRGLSDSELEELTLKLIKQLEN